MTELWIAVAGLIGTLTAVALTGRQQRLNSAAVERRVDDRRLQDRQITAVSDLAGHAVEFRRAALHCWWQAHDAGRAGHDIDFDSTPSAPEMRAARSSAWSSYYRLRLCWFDVDLVRKAESVLMSASAIEHARTPEQAKAQGDEVRVGVAVLTDSARGALHGSPMPEGS